MKQLLHSHLLRAVLFLLYFASYGVAHADCPLACPVTRTITGCSTNDISGPAFSGTPTASSYAVFSDATNQGSTPCPPSSVSYEDEVVSSSCPIEVQRTWTLSDGVTSTECVQTIYVEQGDFVIPGIVERAWAYVCGQIQLPGSQFSSGNFYEINLNTGANTLLGAPSCGGATPSLFAGEFVNGVYYALDDNSKKLVILSQSGACSEVGSLTGLTAGHIVSGLSHNPVTGITYALTTNVSASHLYTIDLSTGALTFVGAIPGVAGGISLMISDAGVAYVIDVNTDDIFPLNLSTAAAGTGVSITYLGNPINLNFAQDADFDCGVNGTIRGVLYTGGGNGRLGTLNPATGVFTQTALLGAEICAFSIDCVTIPVSSTVACPDDTDVLPTPPIVRDACGNVLTPTGPVDSGKPGYGGTRTYTWTYTDCVDNSHDWTYTYSVEEGKAPELVCPANRVVCSNSATNNWVGTGLAPLVLDSDCSTPGLSHKLNNQAFQPGDANGRTFALGSTTVTYLATDTDEGGLTASCAFTVTVRKAPGAYWSQSALGICNGASVNLASYARDSRNAAKRYNFYSGDANGGNLQFLGTVTASNGSVNFGQNHIVTPAGNNSTPVVYYYYVEGVNTFASGPNCTGSLSAALVVTVNPTPVLTANLSPSGQICPGNAVNISFNSSVPATIYWNNSNTGIGLAANGTGNISFNAAAPGTANIFAQASAGACGSAPLQIPLTVSACSQSRMFSTGDDPFGGAGAPQLYPNPSNGQLFLRLPENDAPALYATRLEFFDSAGRRVWSESFELAGGAERRLDLSRLPAGVYGWTLRIGDAGYNGRVVKQ